MSATSLQGVTALVTGAGSGIGAATVEQLSRRGCRVILTGRNAGPLETLAAGLPGEALVFTLDVTDATAVAALPGSLPSDWREVDVLVNNAGHDEGGRRPFVDGTADQWTAIIETNVNGLIRVSHALLPAMVKRGRGHIVNLGSNAGLRGYPGGGAYVASKHAVHGLSECLRLDCIGTGVRVSEVMPGLVRTGFAERRSGDAEQAQRFYDGFDDVLEPDDIARAVVYVLEQPPHVVVAQLMVLPSSQG